MPINAVCYRILVRPNPVEEEREVKTDSGLVVKLHVKVNKKMELNATTMGTIVHIGEDAFAAHHPARKHAGLKVGDKVYYYKYAGQWQVDPKTKEEFLCLNDEDVTAKWVDDDPQS